MINIPREAILNFYEAIARYYDRIFPYDPGQKTFTLEAAANAGFTGKLRVLEAGCGSGSLALALAADGHRVDASDFDRGMVSLAKNKRGESDNPSFRELDMRRIADSYLHASYEAVCCFGNTLVHLDGTAGTEEFFTAAKRVLKPGGRLCLQILHYDRILAAGVDRLPLIEDRDIRFDRFYERRHDGRLDFRTVLITPGGDRIENVIPLYPLRRGELETALRRAGFSGWTHFGGFDRSRFGPDSMALVTEAW
jgi:SAM-dependent methyltransferase